jgi:hypothetical protein
MFAITSAINGAPSVNLMRVDDGMAVTADMFSA